MNYLRNLGVELKTTNSTAEAVEIVRELDNPSAGVIASEEAIKGYGLELLKCGVQDLKNNYSIFWELDTKEREGKYTILMADLENNPGGLYKFLEPFYTKNLNLYSIHSWPEKGGYWFLLKVEAIDTLHD